MELILVSSPPSWQTPDEMHIHSAARVHSAAPALQLIGSTKEGEGVRRVGGWGCWEILWMKPSPVTSIGTVWRMNHVSHEGGGIKEPQPLPVVLKTEEPHAGSRERPQLGNKQQQQQQ